MDWIFLLMIIVLYFGKMCYIVGFFFVVKNLNINGFLENCINNNIENFFLSILLKFLIEVLMINFVILFLIEIMLEIIEVKVEIVIEFFINENIDILSVFLVGSIL